jgi:hypothetical protein
MLFGIKPWAADATNALPLFVFVFALMRLFSGLPLGVALPAVLAALSIPIFGLAMVEFRPDMWCGGLTVAGTLLIALHDPRDTKTAALAGVAFAAALLMKPTFSPLVAILFGAAMVLRLAPYLRDRTWRPAAISCLIVGGIAIMVAGPHYVLDSPALVAYYQEHVFGAGAAIWTPQITKTEKALYYFTGPGGVPSLGKWAYIGALTLAVPVALSVRHHRFAWPAWIIVILTSIAYAVVTVAGLKSAYLGVIFPSYVVAAIILTAVLGLRALYLRKMTGTAYTASILLLCFGAYAYRAPWLLLHGAVYPSYIAASRQAVTDEVASLLKSDPDLARKTVSLPQIGQYLNGEALTFKFLQEGTPAPTLVTEYFSDDLSRHAALLGKSDYVITFTGDYPDGLRWLPSAKITDKINAKLTDGFDLAKAIEPPAQAGKILIYRRSNGH